jgi:hypothetical protein
MDKNILNYYLIGLFLTMVLFSPTIVNYELMVIIALVISAITLSTSFKKKYKLEVIIIPVLVFFLMLIYGDAIKAIFFTFVIIATFIGFTGNKIIIYRLFYLVMVFIYVILVLQIIGYPEYIYDWVTYANEVSPVAILYDSNSSVIGFLPQLRPSGPFPAPTYLSMYCILVASIVMFERSHLGFISQ